MHVTLFFLTFLTMHLPDYHAELFQRSPRQPAEGRLAAEAPKGPELGASWVSRKTYSKSRALFQLKYRTFHYV